MSDPAKRTARLSILDRAPFPPRRRSEYEAVAHEAISRSSRGSCRATRATREEQRNPNNIKNDKASVQCKKQTKSPRQSTASEQSSVRFKRQDACTLPDSTRSWRLGARSAVADQRSQKSLTLAHSPASTPIPPPQLEGCNASGTPAQARSIQPGIQSSKSFSFTATSILQRAVSCIEIRNLIALSCTSFAITSRMKRKGGKSPHSQNKINNKKRGRQAPHHTRESIFFFFLLLSIGIHSMS